MDWNRVEGNWKQVKGKVKEQWGKLTDDDLDVIAGKAGKQDQLEGRLQQRSSSEVVRSLEVVGGTWSRRDPRRRAGCEPGARC